MDSPAMQRDKKCSTTDNAPGGFFAVAFWRLLGALPEGLCPQQPPKGTVLRQVRCRWSIPLLATPAMRPDRGLASWLEWPSGSGSVLKPTDIYKTAAPANGGAGHGGAAPKGGAAMDSPAMQRDKKCSTT